MWYPHIRPERLIPYETESDKKGWEAICQKKRYRVGTVPRNNSIASLGAVITNHLTLIFSAFDYLLHQVSYQEIIDQFIQKKSAEFKLNKQEAQTLKDIVSDKLPAYLIDFQQSASESTSNSNSETGQLSQISHDSDPDFIGADPSNQGEPGIHARTRSKIKLSHFKNLFIKRGDSNQGSSEDPNPKNSHPK